MFSNFWATLNPKIKAVLLSVLAAVILAGFVIFVLNQHATGTLEVTTSSKTAAISVSLLDGTMETIGTGSAKKDLAAGTYQVVAAGGGQQTTAVAVITNGKTTTLKLQLHDLAPIKKVGGDRATNVFRTDNTLLYVNTGANILYSQALGAAVGRPYLSGLGQVSEAFWMGPRQLYTKNATGNWSIVQDQAVSTVGDNSDPLVGASVSFNAAGGQAFVKGHAIVRSTQWGGELKTVGTTKIRNPRTALASDGSLLVFSPMVSDQDPKEAVSLIAPDGKSTNIATKTGTLQFAAWAPNNTMFAYSTTRGFFVFDTKKQAVTQVASLRPSHQESPVWLDGQHMLYATEDGLFAFDTSVRQSQLVSNLTVNSQSSLVFFIEQSGQSIFFGSTTDGQVGIYNILPLFYSADAKTQASLTAYQNGLPAYTPPVFTNLTALNKYGATTDQIAKLKFALSEYAAAAKIGSLEVVVNGGSVVSSRDTGGGEPVNRLEFALTMSGLNLRARFDTKGFSFAQLILYDQGGHEVYNSGAIGELAEITVSHQEINPPAQPEQDSGDAVEIPLDHGDR